MSSITGGKNGGEKNGAVNPRRVDVFFYGLFMDADLLRAKGAHPVNIRAACVPGFALRIGQRATLLRTPDARAYGTVMELTHSEIEQLYSEASVRAYRPESVIAELTDGSHVPALCFNLLVPPDPEEANSEYAAKLRDLGRRLGLPSDYIASIK
jgi:Gamma-glutamyl cyclotransferase, AIG2-like